jgi:tRNA(Ile)-lysidine synthase
MGTQGRARIEPPQVLHRVRATLRRRGLLAGGERVVVAVSGGPDSTALLHLLCRLRQEWRLRLHVVHVEHGLHAASASHAAFVRRTAGAWNVPVAIRRVDAAAEARRRRMSIEHAARTLRYRVLAREARRVGATHIAVGHTADDQVETVLLWMLRGAGDPMVGMPARRPLNGFLVIRPLIDTWRGEVVAYLAGERVASRRDPTNRRRGPVRNRIRHDLLPRLAGYNPGVKAVLRRLAEQAGDDAMLLDQLAGRAGKTVVRRRAGRVRINAGRFLALPVSLQRRVAHSALMDAGGNIRAFAFVHIERLREMAMSGRAGDRADLPGLRAERVAGTIVLARARRPAQRRMLGTRSDKAGRL